VLGEPREQEGDTDLGGGDLLYVQRVVQQLCGREVLLNKVVQDLHPHVWVVDLEKNTHAHTHTHVTKPAALNSGCSAWTYNSTTLGVK